MFVMDGLVPVQEGSNGYSIEFMAIVLDARVDKKTSGCGNIWIIPPWGYFSDLCFLFCMTDLFSTNLAYSIMYTELKKYSCCMHRKVPSLKLS